MSSEPTILAIETATAACSVAVRRGGLVAAGETMPMTRGHAEALMPMVVRQVGEAGLALADIELFAVGIGPGAFTGVRVGLAAARGMALAAGRPCAGIGTLEAVAEAVPAAQRPEGPLVITMDTLRGDLYVQVFLPGTGGAMAPTALPAAALAAALPPGPITLVGDAADGAATHLRAADREVRIVAGACRADAVQVAAIAARRWQAGERFPHRPRPVYLRPPRATPASPSGRQRS
ncbi:MAG: tRNA (adenosine(37)-N6)-threonylcarbamoyltransferase complex dimerization subunit type 1 TsaB [Rhodospirillales bacterium]|nr:MAG: tRNA (adenosine(37)-N6)-threonylcarbamoyltransferase complex dimerization subunit type 1 TsaB [Rhodospirillales bacterium]